MKLAYKISTLVFTTTIIIIPGYKGLANTKYIAKLNLELLQENSDQGDKNIVFIIWRYFQCQQGEVVSLVRL